MLTNLKIGARLSLGFGLVLGLLCLMACAAIWQMGRLAENASSYASDLIPSFEAEHRVSLQSTEVSPERLKFSS
jgi:methyl-accepting chemotaxis protein